MTGPEIRARLAAISVEQANIAKLLSQAFVGRPMRARIVKQMTSLSMEMARLSVEMKRRSPARKSPSVSRPMTPQLKIKIAAYVDAHPDMPMHLIGKQFGVNGGRVSEAYSGKRT